MKVAVFILAALTVAAAAPKQQASEDLQFRNLFVDPIGGIKDEDKKAPRIIGGTEAVANSIKFQAFLTVYSGGSGWYCGGSVISSTVILTAAHCVDGGTSAEVVLGAHRPQTTEATQQRLTGSTLIQHESYDSVTLANDVGLIRLNTAITFNAYVEAVTLPSSGDSSTYAGQTARVSGWGLTNGYGNQISDVLIYVDVPIIENTECGRIFSIVQSSTICTSGDAGTGACNGDSGGPLVIRDTNVQVGIVSFGVTYCLAGYPTGYGRVTSFMVWIEQHLNQFELEHHQ